MVKNQRSTYFSRAVLTLGAEIVIGICAVIGSLFIFLKLADKIIDKQVIFFDSSLIHSVYALRNPAMTSFMKSITFFGGEIFLGAAIIVTILILLKKHKRDAVIFTCILLFGLGLNLLLKDMFQRPRPTFMPLIHETSYSFPSGHAMNSFVFYMSLAYFIFHNTRKKKLSVILTCVFGLLILLIGISRIYLGVHYPSDVLAGYAAGLLWFCLVLLFEKSLLFLRLFKIKKTVN